MKMIERLWGTSNDSDDQFKWFVLANLNVITFLNTTCNRAQLAWALLAYCTVPSDHHLMTTQKKEITAQETVGFHRMTSIKSWGEIRRASTEYCYRYLQHKRVLRVFGKP